MLLYSNGVNEVSQTLGSDSLTGVEEPKVSVDHPVVTLGSKRRVPQPSDGLAVCQERDEGK
jgi:hypothetical protein